MSETALATKESSFSLMSMPDEVKENIAAELDGLGPVSFGTVKIPAGGALAFEIPGDDDDHPETSPELVGVILHHHPLNAYWTEAFSGGNEPPTCSSVDGRMGVITKTGECRECASCPFNQFDSGKDGVGKACKNMNRLYILRSGEMLPMILSVPPTSLKALKSYLTRAVLMKGKLPAQVITKITLKKEKNSTGIVYSSAVFSKVADLDPADYQVVKDMAAYIKSIASYVPADAEEKPHVVNIDAEGPAEEDGFTEVKNDGWKEVRPSAEEPADENGFTEVEVKQESRE